MVFFDRHDLSLHWRVGGRLLGLKGEPPGTHAGHGHALAQLELAEDLSRDTAIRLAETARERFGLEHRLDAASADDPARRDLDEDR